MVVVAEEEEEGEEVEVIESGTVDAVVVKVDTVTVELELMNVRLAEFLVEFNSGIEVV